MYDFNTMYLLSLITKEDNFYRHDFNTMDLLSLTTENYHFYWLDFNSMYLLSLTTNRDTVDFFFIFVSLPE